MPLQYTKYSFIMSLVFGITSAFLAKKQDRNPLHWFLLGTLFGAFGVFYLFFSFKPKSKAKDPNTIDITPLESIEPAFKESFWYYLSPENQQIGPMSFFALQKAYEQGKISKKTYIWNEKFESWEFFDQVFPETQS